MRAPTERSQGLSGERQRLRVEIETQQFTVRRTGLQYSAGMSARADRAVHIAPRAVWTHRVYNLLVKYGLMRHDHVVTNLFVPTIWKKDRAWRSAGCWLRRR